MSGFNSEQFVQRWHRLTLMEQLGNVGSEVERVISWRNKNNPELATKALYRSLELLDLTIADPRWRDGKLKEIARVREVLCDTFVGNNTFNTTPEYLSKYFYAFASAARRSNGK